MPLVPLFRRWLSKPVLERLTNRLAPAITVLRGPRQVGKTTLQQQIILLLQEEEEVDPRQIFHVQFDIVGCYLRTLPGLDVFWYPARRQRPEIDFLLVVGDWRIPVEVKYRRRIDPRRDVETLCSFVDDELNRAPFGLLVTLSDDFKVDDPRVVALPLPSFLLLR